VPSWLPLLGRGDRSWSAIRTYPNKTRQLRVPLMDSSPVSPLLSGSGVHGTRRATRSWFVASARRCPLSKPASAFLA